MNSSLISVSINEIYEKIIGNDNMASQTERNALIEESGVVMKNVNFPITEDGKVYYFKIIDASQGNKKIECGKIAENVFKIIETQIKNNVIVVDFDGVETVSYEFCKSWAKILLETTNKIITINMNISITKTFANFVIENFDVEE